MKMEHGGDMTGASLRSGIPEERLLDFSVNVTPLGIPETIRKAMEDSLDRAGMYPDLSKKRLREAIGKKHHIPASWVCCGNGASDLIFRLVFALKPEKALILAPTFVEYASALRCVSCRIDHYRLSHEDFDVREDILEKITRSTDLVILCNPNNPTGRLIPKNLMEAVGKRCADVGAKLLVDECFLEFTKEPEKVSMEDRLERYPGMVLLKSFTKMFGIAGLRLGYMLCSDEGLCQAADRFGCDWNVNCVAEAAGLAALKADDHVREVVACVAEEREYLLNALGALGIQTVRGKANYLLFRIPGEDRLYEKLLEKGIMIRTCDNYEGLGKDYYRIGVRTHEENVRLVACLGELIKTPGKMNDPAKAGKKEDDR